MQAEPQTDEGKLHAIKTIFDFVGNTMSSPLVLICSENKNLSFIQAPSNEFRYPSDVAEAVLSHLRGADQDMESSRQEDTRMQPSDATLESDEMDEEFDVATELDLYEKEEDLLNAESDEVNNMLGMFIDQTEVMLGSLDSTVESVQAGKADTSSSVESEVPGPIPPSIQTHREAVQEDGIEWELKRTAFLSEHDLVFNEKYKLIICEACDIGLPLSSVWSHLKSEEVSIWCDNPSEMGTTRYRAKHRFLAGFSKEKFKDAVVADLIKEGLVESRDDILTGGTNTEWRDLGNKVRAGRTPIQGVRTFIGVACKFCDEGARSATHMVSNHGHRDPNSRYPPRIRLEDVVQGVRVQTFSEVFRVFYRVDCDSFTLPKRRRQGSNEPTVLELLDEENDRIRLTLPEHMLHPPNFQWLPPIFHHGQVETWVSRLDRSAIHRKLPALPRANDPERPVLFDRLRISIFKLFAEDLRLLQQNLTHAEMPHLLTNGSVNQNRRRLTILTRPETIHRYASTELKLIWMLMEYHAAWKPPSRKRKRDGDDGKDASIFVLGEHHRRSLQNLRKALNSGRVTKIDNSVREVTSVLYFPSKEDRDKSYFDAILVFPLLQFIIVSFLTEAGNYMQIHRLPPILARHQYAMRLRATHIIDGKIRDGNADDWKRIALSFIDEYLVDFSDAPFSIMRFWMHGLSVVARNTPRPNIIWWNKDDILFRDHRINFPEYREKTYRMVLGLESLFLNEILFGLYTMDEAETVFGLRDLNETGDETTLGHGVIANTQSPLMTTNASRIFFSKLFDEKKLGACEGTNGGVAFDNAQALLWLASIHKAVSMLVAACHVLTITGRGTEWETISPTNNENGPRGVIYDPGACTGAFSASYHKGLTIQGVNKMSFSSTAEKDSISRAYNQHIFASFGKAWVSQNISKALKDWFQEVVHIKIDVGLQNYRHLAVAIQRRFIIHSDENPFKDQAVLNQRRSQQIVAVTEDHHDRETQSGSSLPSEKDLELKLARDYHRVMGFTTGFDETPLPEAAKLQQQFQYQTPKIVPPRKVLIAAKGGPNLPTLPVPLSVPETTEGSIEDSTHNTFRRSSRKKARLDGTYTEKEVTSALPPLTTPASPEKVTERSTPDSNNPPRRLTRSTKKDTR